MARPPVRRSTSCMPAMRPRSRRSRRSACRDRCTARPCSTPQAGPSPLHPLERRPQRPAVRSPDPRMAGAACRHRKPGHARLHRAEAHVGARARARAVRAGRQRAPAQGLAALAPVRRAGRGPVRRLGHALARRRPARWSDAALAATGMRREQMPRLAEGSEPAGELSPEWVRRWGFRRAPLLAGGAGDNAAGSASASARSGRGTPSCRSARRASSGSRPDGSRPRPSTRSMPSVMPFRGSGIRWGWCCRPPRACAGGPASPAGAKPSCSPSSTTP